MNTNIMIVEDMTFLRMAVIKQRTSSELVAGYKAALIQSLKDKLQNGVAHFIFKKKNGELRECFGTCVPSVARKHIVGTGDSRENYATTAFWDIEKGEWRSFRWESLVKVF